VWAKNALAMSAYLDQMSSLLLERDLRESEEDSEVRTLARARTLAVLSGLDRRRKTAVMHFLVEEALIQSVEGKGPIIRACTNRRVAFVTRNGRKALQSV
jgi:predicted YcjX-like family ATPase